VETSSEGVEVEEESELLDTELHSVEVGVVNFGVGVSSLVVGTLFDSVDFIEIHIL